MSSEAAKGQTAIDHRYYEEAVAQYTLALKKASSPLWFINRSTAYQRLQKYDLALNHANNAVITATERGRRELIAAAQFRRAVTLHALKRYGDSRLCLTWCRKLNDKEKALGIWQAKVSSDYERAKKDGMLDMIKCTVKEIPDCVTEEKEVIKPVSEPKPTPVAAALPPTVKEKVRHEWYQSSSQVTITIFAKGVPKEKAEVNIEEYSLEVRFPTGDSAVYDYTVTPLFAKIDTSSSDFRITPHKIEINLHKSDPGIKWARLEGTKDIAPPSTTVSRPTVPAAAMGPEKDKSPLYPTSSRTGPKNWDNLASVALQQENEKEGLGEDDDDGGDPMGGFFKKLYKDADPDTRRAMMKSYQESNGTALSTNWAEVKKGTVETKPPEGVEAKKWGQ